MFSKPARLRLARGGLALGLLACVLTATSSATAGEPRLSVPKGELSQALHCVGEVRDAKVQPIMLVTGTGATGAEAYAIGKGALDALGRPVCYVDFPDFTTADIQVSAQYLVYGIRVVSRRAGRPIAVFGISQGGLLPRWALTYWPSLRSKVTDVLAAAGTQHGTTLRAFGDCAKVGCAPAIWQQAAGSKLLRALNRRRDETPGPTAWTTVRSATDETVKPQTGKHPTSALRGATNILIQSVCPGRRTTHIGTALDSVTLAAFVDAISHRGPAKVSRLPSDVCAHPYGPGLDEQATASLLSGAGFLVGNRELNIVPRVKREPTVRAYARH